jgi:hypothetical protein
MKTARREDGNFTRFQGIDRGYKRCVGVRQHFELRRKENGGSTPDEDLPTVLIDWLNCWTHHLVAIAQLVENVGNNRNVKLARHALKERSLVTERLRLRSFGCHTRSPKR